MLRVEVTASSSLKASSSMQLGKRREEAEMEEGGREGGREGEMEGGRKRLRGREHRHS